MLEKLLIMASNYPLENNDLDYIDIELLSPDYVLSEDEVVYHSLSNMNSNHVSNNYQFVNSLLNDSDHADTVYAVNENFNPNIAPPTNNSSISEKPDLVVTDNGPEFTSCEFQKFCADRNIKTHTCAPYHKESNGLVERANLQVELALRCYVMEKGKSWVNHLQEVTTALNNSIHANVQYTPNEILNNKREILDLPGLIKSEYKLCRNYRNIYDRVKNQLRKTKNVMLNKINKKRKYKAIKIGDYVFYKNNDINSKLQPLFLGPCKVIDKNTDFSYVLLDKYNVKHLVHRNHIKV